MRGKLAKTLGIAVAVVIAVSCALLFSSLSSGITGGGKEVKQRGSDAAGEAKGLISLTEPAFAAETQTAGTNFLEKEAGISTYTNVGQELDLGKAKTEFKTIEHETDEYIIGSVGLPGLSETEDTHIYVHKDGWVVAYYLKEEPIAKIIDWSDLSTTKLEEGLGKPCNAAGVPFVEVTYYDFRYPNAETLMVITDYDSFRLKIPSSFAVYERTYSFYDSDASKYHTYGQHYYSTPSTFSIDGTKVASVNGGVVTGTLTPTQLRPDVFHTIKSYCKRTEDDHLALVLAYKEG